MSFPGWCRGLVPLSRPIFVATLPIPVELLPALTGFRRLPRPLFPETAAGADGLSPVAASLVPSFGSCLHSAVDDPCVSSLRVTFVTTADLSWKPVPIFFQQLLDGHWVCSIVPRHIWGWETLCIPRSTALPQWRSNFSSVVWASCTKSSTNTSGLCKNAAPSFASSILGKCSASGLVIASS